MSLLALEDVHQTSLLQRAATPAFVGAKALVSPTQALVFVSRGQVAGMLGPGEHVLDPRAVPFLASIVEQRPTAAVLGDDVFWVLTGGSRSVEVSGALEPSSDMSMGEKITPRLNARIGLSVADPVRLVHGLAGNTDHGAVEQWVKAQVLSEARALAAKVPRLADLVAEPKLIEHSRALGAALAPGLGELGLALTACEVIAFVVPDYVASRLRLLGGTPTQYAEAPAPTLPTLAEGARVRTSRGGQWYSGRVARTSAEGVEVVWDVSNERSVVGPSELEAEPSYPGAFTPGTRVLAEWPGGGFYPATVRIYNGTLYEVLWSDGSASWLGPGQVRMG